MTRDQDMDKGRVAARLAAHGIVLPPPGRPAGSYVPFTVAGGLVFIAGQVPVEDGRIVHRGKLGGGLSVAEGQAAARLCALNLIAQLREACGGDLDRVRACLKVTGFVNCTAEFTEQPAVINGASDLIVEVLGDAGRHARVAVGAPSLPFDAAVEVDGIFAIAP